MTELGANTSVQGMGTGTWNRDMEQGHGKGTWRQEHVERDRGTEIGTWGQGHEDRDREVGDRC